MMSTHTLSSFLSCGEGLGCCFFPAITREKRTGKKATRRRSRTMIGGGLGTLGGVAEGVLLVFL